MAITLNIVKNNPAWTNMRIFRAATAAAVYGGAPLADAAIAATYVDATAVDGQIYYYGIELYNASDKTQFPVLKAAAVTDYGPLTAQVQSNITGCGSPLMYGDTEMGVIMRPTLAQFANMPGFPNTNTRLTAIYKAAAGGTDVPQPSGDNAMAIMMLGGKVVAMPTTNNFSFRNQYDTLYLNDLKKIYDYLNANPAEAFFDVAGYRWKMKVLTKEFVQKYPDLVTTIYGANNGMRRFPQIFNPVAAYSTWFCIQESDASVIGMSIDANGAPSFAANTGGTNNGRMAIIYFEFVGQTPA
jgi:hypothetical protein